MNAAELRTWSAHALEARGLIRKRIGRRLTWTWMAAGDVQFEYALDVISTFGTLKYSGVIGAQPRGFDPFWFELNQSAGNKMPYELPVFACHIANFRDLSSGVHRPESNDTFELEAVLDRIVGYAARFPKTLAGLADDLRDGRFGEWKVEQFAYPGAQLEALQVWMRANGHEVPIPTFPGWKRRGLDTDDEVRAVLATHQLLHRSPPSAT